MNPLGLLAVLFVLAAPGGASGAPLAPKPEAVVEARRAMERFVAALAPLKRGDESPAANGAAREKLAAFRDLLSSLRPAPEQERSSYAERWRALRDAVESASAPGADLLKRGEKVSSAFSALFPAPVATLPDGGRIPSDEASRRRSSAAVNRSLARGAGARVDGDGYFDGSARGRGAATAGSGAGGGRGPVDTRPLEPVNHLASRPVPPPQPTVSGSLMAGVVDAFKEQFGTVKGLVTNLLFMAGGLLLGALSGGVGILVGIVKALCAIAVLWTLWSMIKRLISAIATARETGTNDPRHWAAIREMGKLGGEILIIALMSFVGYKIGERPAVKNALGSMTEALSSKLGGKVFRATPEMKAAVPEAQSEPEAPQVDGNRSKIDGPPEPEPRSKPSARERFVTSEPAPRELKALGVDEVKFPRRQLQHEFEHAGDLGIKGNSSNATLAEFQQAIMKHIRECTPIKGKYRQTIDVIHLFDPRSGVNVMIRPDGEFLGAWKLTAAQIANVRGRGSL